VQTATGVAGDIRIHLIAASSWARRSLLAIAPPVDRPNVVGMIVPPRPSHAAGIDVVGDDVAIIGEPPLAEGAYALLGDDLPVEELPHLAVGAEFPVSPGMVRVLDTPYADLAPTLFPWHGISSAAEEGTVDRAELIPAESHGVLLIGFGAIVGWDGQETGSSASASGDL